MNHFFRLFLRTGVALFCVWHMVAVASYAIPNEIENPLSARVRPYMLLTSQWQQWNLFSPDPLRRVVFYRIESQNVNGDWEPVGSIDDTTYGPLRHSLRFKLLGQAFAEGNARIEPVSEQAARVLCREFGVFATRRIRVWRDIAVVPQVPPPSWVPAFEPVLAVDTSCTDRSR